MSRIGRYMDSVSRFLKNKSCLSEIKHNTQVMEIISNLEHIPCILLLTVLNNQSRKNEISLNGYYISSSIETMLIIANLLDRNNYYDKIYDSQKIIIELIGQINICLAQNIDSLQLHYKDKSIKMIQMAIKFINSRLIKILNNDQIETDKKIKKSDLAKFHFENKDNRQKLAELKQVQKESLLNFINNKYGTICQLALILGWLFGGGTMDDKTVQILDKLGEHFGIIVKLSTDFDNLEEDISSSDQYSKNYIINYGLQNSFELFMENKQKFIEGCMVLDIYTNTIKELIDLIENKIDKIIDNSSPDMASQHTL